MRTVWPWLVDSAGLYAQEVPVIELVDAQRREAELCLRSV